MSKATSKRKLKFNIVDVFIIIVLIGALIIGSRILGLGRKMGIGLDGTKATFTVELSEGTLELFNQMKVGDVVNIALDSVDYATITEISEPTPTTVQTFDTITGKYKFAAPENPKYSAFITVEAEANENESSIFVGNTEVKVGKPIFIKGKGYSGKGFIVKLDTSSQVQP